MSLLGQEYHNVVSLDLEGHISGFKAACGTDSRFRPRLLNADEAEGLILSLSSFSLHIFNIN